MYKKITIIIMALSAISITIPVLGGTTPVNTKATATLAGSCQISAQNVNFGSLNIQSAAAGIAATSNMTLYCTKGSAYTVGLSYGGAYGQGNQSYTLNYLRYNNGCIYGGTFNGTFYSTSVNAQNCDPTFNYHTTAYNYGVLNGASKGDTIGYKITLPGDDTKVWNNGYSSYNNTGNGMTQSLPIKATIQTGTHGSQYPAADTYSDTITATVSY